jgi:hypothetical protein
MSAATAYIHLPGVLLRYDQFPLGPGVIRRLPFEEWRRLDGAPRDVDRKYDRSAPAFLVFDIADDEARDMDRLLAHLSQASAAAHEALLLDSRGPRLPTPSLSARYVAFPEDAGMRPTLRLFGPMEREWIVFRSDLAYEFDADALTALRAAYDLLDERRRDRMPGEAAAAIEALERTARPDSWWGGDLLRHAASDFVQCVAACENMLRPSGDERPDESLTDMFGRRAAVLLCGRHEELAARAAELSDLYRLRSRLTHGRIGLTDMTEEETARLPLARPLLCALVLAVLRVAPAAEREDLSATLAAAFADLDAFDVLRRRLDASP